MTDARLRTRVLYCTNGNGTTIVTKKPDQVTLGFGTWVLAKPLTALGLGNRYRAGIMAGSTTEQIRSKRTVAQVA
jgi:hypothetical protein